MADNQDTLGSFKIDVAVQGKEKVKADLEDIRKGLKELENGFKKSAKEGKHLADVMKELHKGGSKATGSKDGTSAGGSGKTASEGVYGSFKSVLGSFAKDAKKAADAVSIFTDAVKKSLAATKSLSRASEKATDKNITKVKENTFATVGHTKVLGRMSKAADKVIGHEIKDSEGNGTGEYTGLMGLNQSAIDSKKSFTQTVKASDAVYTSFKKLVGENNVTKDPVTGEVTDVKRSGSKGLLHSFDALSKAAKGAAKNLDKIAKNKGTGSGGGAGGGAGGGGGGGGGDLQSSIVDKYLKRMKESGKATTSLGKFIRELNVGNLSGLNKVASVLDAVGRHVSLLKQGPAGVAMSAGTLAVQAYTKNEELKSEGKGSAQKNYKYKKRLDSSGLNYNKVAKDALDNKMAYTQWKKDAEGRIIGIDAVATDEAARNAAAGNAENMANSWAMFETRGIESPWMSALANQGIDYTQIKDYGTLKKTLAERYQQAKAAGEDSDEMKQWRTLKQELGGFVRDEDYEAITYEGEKNPDGTQKYAAGIEGFAAKSKAMGTETAGSAKNLALAEYTFSQSVEQGGAKHAYDAEINKNIESMKTATGWLSKLGDGCRTVKTNLELLGRQVFNLAFGDSTKDQDISKRREMIGNAGSSKMFNGLGQNPYDLRSTDGTGPVKYSKNPITNEAAGDYRTYRGNPLEKVDRSTVNLDSAESNLKYGPLKGKSEPISMKMDFNVTGSQAVQDALNSDAYKREIENTTNTFLQSNILR